MELSQGKSFEKPAPAMYLATLIDVVEMPKVQTAYGIKDRIRLHWVLAHLNGQLYLGKDGTPVEAVWMGNANMGGKAELPKRLTQILGQAPPVLQSTEQLEQLIIGRSNILVLVASPNAKNPNEPFVNVDGIGAIQPGMPAPPPIPAGYVRHKFRPKTQAGPNGQSVQTYATNPAAYAAPNAAPAGYPQTSGYIAPPGVPAAVPTPAAPTAEQIAAFLAAQAGNQAPKPAAPIDLNAPQTGKRDF